MIELVGRHKKSNSVIVSNILQIYHLALQSKSFKQHNISLFRHIRASYLNWVLIIVSSEPCGGIDVFNITDVMASRHSCLSQTALVFNN